MIPKENDLNLKKTGSKQMSWGNIYQHCLIVQLLWGKSLHTLSGALMIKIMR